MQSERQQRLREHARRLIAETRTKSINLDSPSSPIKSITQRGSLSPERTISPINPSADSLVLNNNNKNLANNNNHSPSRGDPLGDLTIDVNNRNNSSPAKFVNGDAKHSPSFGGMMDKISPRSESKDQISYIQSELDALEREQEAIDLKASALEGKLRAVMGGDGGKWWRVEGGRCRKWN